MEQNPVEDQYRSCVTYGRKIEWFFQKSSKNVNFWTGIRKWEAAVSSRVILPIPYEDISLIGECYAHTLYRLCVWIERANCDSCQPPITERTCISDHVHVGNTMFWVYRRQLTITPRLRPISARTPAHNYLVIIKASGRLQPKIALRCQPNFQRKLKYQRMLFFDSGNPDLWLTDVKCEPLEWRTYLEKIQPCRGIYIIQLSGLTFSKSSGRRLRRKCYERSFGKSECLSRSVRRAWLHYFCGTLTYIHKIHTQTGISVSWSSEAQVMYEQNHTCVKERYGEGRMEK